MRVALTSYPMLFQRLGGLQVQVRETLSALSNIDIDVKLFDSNNDRLGDFDIVHVFGAMHGNHRIIESAKNAGCRTVISPVQGPPFSQWQSRLARFCDAATRRLTRWEFHTSYGQIKQAVGRAGLVIALGEDEYSVLTRAYSVDPEKIVVIPNGVAERYFEASEDVFRTRQSFTARFALQVGSISSHKNQLTSVRALSGTGLDLMLIGPCADEDRPYLDKCLSEGRGRVHYLGSFSAEDPLLASAYAAADLFVLPSISEVMPLVVLESLAAGTPVVMTKHSSLKFADPNGCVLQVGPHDVESMGLACRQLCNEGPDRKNCQSLVSAYRWNDVAGRLSAAYERVLSSAAE